MNTLILEHEVRVSAVSITKDALVLDLNDGRRMSVPLAWYPRLLNGTVAERKKHELIGDGEGIHWPDLDEDISVEGILAGRPSQESSKSLAKWLEKRGKKLKSDPTVKSR